MLNEAEVKKILDKRLSDYACTVSIKTPFGEAFHGIDTKDIAHQICSLQPKVELPLLTENPYIVTSKSKAYQNPEYLVRQGTLVSAYENGKQAQRDADLHAIGTAGVWQERPDRPGWWVRCNPTEKTKDRVFHITDLAIKVCRFHKNELWFFIPEPQKPEGK